MASPSITRGSTWYLDEGSEEVEVIAVTDGWVVGQPVDQPKPIVVNRAWWLEHGTLLRRRSRATCTQIVHIPGQLTALELTA